MQNISIVPLTADKFEEAVDLVFTADLDTREEIEHHLEDLAAHYIAVDTSNTVLGVVGWYQDTVQYATEAMGADFPGEDAYWVGFFAVDEQYRGKGVGFMLINTLQEVLTEKGISELWVSSVPESAEYYTRQGFIKYMDGEISNSPKVFMVKRW